MELNKNKLNWLPILNDLNNAVWPTNIDSKSENKIQNKVKRNIIIIGNKEVEHIGLRPTKNDFTQLHYTQSKSWYDNIVSSSNNINCKCKQKFEISKTNVSFAECLKRLFKIVFSTKFYPIMIKDRQFENNNQFFRKFNIIQFGCRYQNYYNFFKNK